MLRPQDDWANEPMDHLEPYRDLRHQRRSEYLIAEGTWVVNALLGSDLETFSVVMRETVEGGTNIPEGIPVVRLSKKEINELVGYEFHHRVLACARRPAAVRWIEEEETFAKSPEATIAVCPSLADASNLGAIVRSAAALGIEAVLVPENTGADPFCRKAIRASSGTVFRLPVLECRHLKEDMRAMNGRHAVIGSTLEHSAQAIQHYTVPERKKFLILGSEADGLDEEWTNLCTEFIRIPMASGIDSLNVAAAAAILFHTVGSLREK